MSPVDFGKLNARPMSEVSGVLAGIRAGLLSYAQAQRTGVSSATADEEMFI